VWISVIVVLIICHSHALLDNTICYCDCYKGASCVPTTTYVNSSVDTCSLSNCYSQCYRLPACQITNRNGSVAAYCSSNQARYSSNPIWDGNYITMIDPSPIGCCYINNARITSHNSSLNLVGTSSCGTDVLTLTLPFPTGNTLAFQIGYNQEIAMTLDNSQLQGHSIDSSPQCNFTLNRSNTTVNSHSSSTGNSDPSSTSSVRSPSSSAMESG
jgi:hypothetical protein